MTVVREGIWCDDREKPGHRWGDPVIVSRTRIERRCTVAGCGAVKVTMVLPRHAWREWRRAGDVASWRGQMPACRCVAS